MSNEFEEKNISEEETEKNTVSKDKTAVEFETAENIESAIPEKKSSLAKIMEFIFPEKVQKAEKTKIFDAPEIEYVKRLLKFNEFYTQFVAILAVLAVLSILVTIYAYLIVGFAAAFFVCIIYVNFTSDELFKSLGVTYKSIIGGISITIARAKYGEVLILPSRLMWLDVIQIEDRAFSSPKNAEMTAVYLPATLEKIGENIFEDCPSLKRVYFEGNEERWQTIESGTNFSPYEIVYNTTYPQIPKKVPKKKEKKQKN